jgi:hypothetical protein
MNEKNVDYHLSLKLFVFIFQLTVGVYMLRYRQSSSMSGAFLVAPTYLTGCGQTGAQSTAS